MSLQRLNTKFSNITQKRRAANKKVEILFTKYEAIEQNLKNLLDTVWGLRNTQNETTSQIQELSTGYTSLSTQVADLAGSQMRLSDSFVSLQAENPKVQSLVKSLMTKFQTKMNQVNKEIEDVKSTKARIVKTEVSLRDLGNKVTIFEKKKSKTGEPTHKF